MTRYTRTCSPLPIDTASGAVSLDYASTRLTRGLRRLWKSIRNRMAARTLGDMSDRDLADIGLTRQDVIASFSGHPSADPTVELAQRARMNSRSMRT